jgi:hypothetical protein
VRHELEEVHHLTEAGDAGALLSRSLWFVDQYNALGKALSQMASRAPRGEPPEEALRRQAIQAYERALAHDASDAYAHHYIAYNLDILAADPARAEREYVVARDLEPTHAWYHSRYIRFLITTAWMTEARAAWERAFDGLGGAPRPLDYEELHGQVARLLLHRGELDFAREVLEDVPEEQRASPFWGALHRLLVYLEEERDELLVFPPGLSLPERWAKPLDYKDSTRELKAWGDEVSSFHDADLPKLFPSPDRYIRRGFARP